MDNLKSTTARLRRTFAYPTDESSSTGDSPDVLDEEEQETLIASLAGQNAQRDGQFRLLLYLLPALSAIPYVLCLFFLRRSSFPALASLLALTSLASTAYLLHRLPPTATGLPWLDRSGVGPRVVAGDDDDDDDDDNDGDGAGAEAFPRNAPVGSRRGRGRGASSFNFADLEYHSPLERWLPYMNVGLCAAAALLGLAVDRSGNGNGGEAGRPGTDGSAGLVGLALLPALVYGVVLLAKTVMAGVDPEKELGGLRYEHKGA